VLVQVQAMLVMQQFHHQDHQVVIAQVIAQATIMVVQEVIIHMEIHPMTAIAAYVSSVLLVY